MHWTETSTDDFLYMLMFDVTSQLASAEKDPCDNKDPSDFTLKEIIKIARSMGKKISVVLYNDGDKKNDKGPISSSIFEACWELMGKPTNFFEFSDEDLKKIGHEDLIEDNDKIDKKSQEDRSDHMR